LSENADWENIFKEIDLDGDGKIDFDEFFAASVDHRKILTQ
jgi:Ca2+-binding EF-hand superfamily protein